MESQITKTAWRPPKRLIGQLSKKTLKSIRSITSAKPTRSSIKLHRAIRSKPVRIFKSFFKGKTPVPVGTNKYLKQHRFIEMATHSARMRRTTLRKQLSKNKITALSVPKYRKLVGRQLKRYGREVARDFRHPIKSFKRQTKMLHYHVNPITGKITKRSPVGMAATGSYLFGIPAYYGVTEFTGKDAKRRPFGEKLTRSLSMTLPMMSPRALPSMTAYHIPEVIFKKKKKKRINLATIPVDDILRMTQR